MKFTNLIAISILASSINGLSKYTTPMTWVDYATNKGTGCARCIRSEFIFCSNEFYKHVAPSGSSKSFCCQSTDQAKCPDIYTTGVRDTTIVCSNDFANNDIALGACPQDPAKCGGEATNTYDFKKAGDPAATEITFSGDITQDDKCTFIVKAECDAPGFELAGMTDGGARLQINYVEYDGQITTMDSTNTYFPDKTMVPLVYDAQQTIKANTLGAVKWYINPNEPQVSEQRFRYIGGDFVLDAIATELLHYYTPYETLRDAYNVKAQEYTAALKEHENKIKSGQAVGNFNRIKPTRPTDPDDYEGLFMEMQHIAQPYPAKSVQPALDRGGWGSLTSGMLSLTGGEKSFGVFGQGNGNTEGITKDFRSMNAATCSGEKYMMVTVLPTYETAYSQSTQVQAPKQLKLKLGAYAWGAYQSKFAKPSVPTLAITL